MTNKELRIVLQNLYRMQLDAKNIFKYLDENTEQQFLSLQETDQNLDQTIHEVQALILGQCEECSSISEIYAHDEKCSIGRQEEIEQQEIRYDDNKESQWIESQQISEGKL